MSVGSASKAAKVIKFHPHRVWAVHELKSIGAPQRFGFVTGCWKMWTRRSELLFITDEAYFHVSGYITFQNTQIWSDGSTHTVHQILLHDIKIGVWCLVSGKSSVQCITTKPWTRTSTVRNTL
jgi:hypothetical protein